MTAPTPVNDRKGLLTPERPSAALVAIITATLLTACGDKAATAARGGDVDFGIVVQGKKLEHTFVVHNDKPAPVTIARLSGCDICTVARFDSVIPPGKDARIVVSIDTKTMRGPIGQRLEVALRDSGRQQPRAVYFRVRGGVVFPIELTPDNQIYFFGVEGERQRDTVLVTNHRPKPLNILAVTSDNPRIRVGRVTHEQGRRYRIDVALDSGAPAGRHRARVAVRTDSPELPTFVIHAFAVLDRIVDVSPRKVDFGMIPLARLDRSEMLREQTILVKKYRGKDFQVVRATIDNPLFEVKVEPQTVGESFYVHIAIVPKRAKKGALTGTLTIETNDPAFSKLTLPISGTLL